MAVGAPLVRAVFGISVVAMSGCGGLARLDGSRSKEGKEGVSADAAVSHHVDAAAGADAGVQSTRETSQGTASSQRAAGANETSALSAAAPSHETFVPQAPSFERAASSGGPGRSTDAVEPILDGGLVPAVSDHADASIASPTDNTEAGAASSASAAVDTSTMSAAVDTSTMSAAVDTTASVAVDTSTANPPVGASTTGALDDLPDCGAGADTQNGETSGVLTSSAGPLVDVTAPGEVWSGRSETSDVTTVVLTPASDDTKTGEIRTDERAWDGGVAEDSSDTAGLASATECATLLSRVAAGPDADVISVRGNAGVLGAVDYVIAGYSAGSSGANGCQHFTNSHYGQTGSPDGISDTGLVTWVYGADFVTPGLVYESDHYANANELGFRIFAQSYSVGVSCTVGHSAGKFVFYELPSSTTYRTGAYEFHCPGSDIDVQGCFRYNW